MVLQEVFGEFPFLLAEIVPPQELSENDMREFDALYQQMFGEFKSESKYKNKILGNLFLIILLKIKEKFWCGYDPLEEGNNSSQIVKAFKQLLENAFKDIMIRETSGTRVQAQDLAEQLNIHPNYLNSVIKSKTGKTVNDWISSRTLSTAKTMLTGTNLSAKEISYKLGFSEPTHFNRFFKNQIGLSPGAFRKSNQHNS